MGGKNSYESIKRYEDKAYDKVLVRFPKGKKDIIKIDNDFDVDLGDARKIRTFVVCLYGKYRPQIMTEITP